MSFGKQLPPADGKSSKHSVGLRLNLFFFGTFFIFCIIIVRLAGLQFTEGALLTEEEIKRDTKFVPLAAMRGIIFAAGGEQIAYSTPVESLYLTLNKEYTAKTTDKVTGETSLTEKAKNKSNDLAARLVAEFEKYGSADAPKLTQQDVLDLLDLDFKKYLGYVPRRIKAGLTSEEIAYFMEHKDEYPGITIVEESVRHYDKDTVAVQTVGFGKPFKSTEDIAMYKNIRSAMKDNSSPGLMYKTEEYVGFDGLEMQYQRELRGENGYQVISVTPQNMAEKVEQTVPPIKGNNIWMTINKNVQMKTEQAILDQIKWLHTNAVQGETHPDALTGYAVAMEVETGNIVAMASMPDYDSNVWTKDSLPTSVWNKIMNNHLNGTITSNSSGRSGHDFSSLVFLGSTIKPLSVLIGLNEGFFNTSSTYPDVGITYFGKDDKSSVRNSSGHVYGKLYPADAIKQSSNVFMVDMVGKQLYKKYLGDKGVEVWDEYMKKFGLGVSTQSGLPGESPGQINYTDFKAAGSSQAALVYASFGQQGSYTTLQLAQYATTLANEGVRIKPQLVSKITDAQGKVVKEFKKEVLNSVTFDKSFWREIKQGMSSKVSAFDDFPYDFARKTGTSEKTDRKNINRDNGVFIAFAPRENPKLAVAVVIPEGGFGSNSAAPVARKIFDAYDWEYGLDGVPKKNIPPVADPVQEQ
ncbi:MULTISPECIES: penicillin-binding transpeptidase domain-containing protein [unclassified Paenibacillus]|uniref:peptidoglycan D,D-transpeptidase FtsI family protein n=1 Tax=unclassified Paenibacillus TaxID=185978 RepID=UPI0024737502|nr:MULTISPECIES: penicillin-binding transpeptidase domain-containing protein [unclassified Paenibacillus]MDH6430951.1 cell division protein FtsI/penicillin-binding protein 2 [Paenibacillus sp. PastH-4]MDH6446849.1 cell division protein FtsI/penicillin-binding protein 2 [Paenibacillus sp. PastF-4]MDH6531068.1 cell division protein FtsI/penicillin-binding protein 2 [Paenibacillus sp. PastH-3]